MAPAGVELALGMVRDPLLGPLVAGRRRRRPGRAGRRPGGGPAAGVAGGRDAGAAAGCKVGRLLDGFRGSAPADADAVIAAVVGLSQLAVELGDALDALDVNPVLRPARPV